MTIDAPYENYEIHKVFLAGLVKFEFKKTYYALYVKNRCLNVHASLVQYNFRTIQIRCN